MKYAKHNKTQWNGKQQKSNLDSISKVLCLILMTSCLSECLLNYITIYYSIFIQFFPPLHLVRFRFKNQTEIYKQYFRDIQEKTDKLLSKDMKIFRIKTYTFVTVIKSNEYCEDEVRLEGMLHFKLCIFLKLWTSQPIPLVSRD